MQAIRLGIFFVLALVHTTGLVIRRCPEIDRLSNTAVAKSGLQVSGAAECCRSTVRNRCVTGSLVGGLCNSVWS